MTILACIVYAAAMVAANASVAVFGAWVSPINSFVLIGLDLALRDLLHFKLTRIGMAALIAGAGLATYVLNAAPPQIAIASAVAFAVAACADWFTFSALQGRSWLRRSNCSNIVGAGFDSMIFPTLAFGVVMPGVIAMQFAAKVIGGAIWSGIIAHAALPRHAR